MLESERLEDVLGRRDLDLIVATSRQNVFYMTGLKVLPQWIQDQDCFSVWSPNDGLFLVFPPVSSNQVASAEAEFDDVYSYGQYFYYSLDGLSDLDARVQWLSERNTGFEDSVSALSAAMEDVVGEGDRVAIETTGLAESEFSRVTKDCAGEVVDATQIFVELRRTKSEAEQNRLKRAAEIVEHSVNESLEILEPGLTERELAIELQQKMIEKGAYQVPVPNVSFGTNTAHALNLPYEEFGSEGVTRLKDGDLIRFDTGCVYKGYWSDIGRTYSYRSIDPHHAEIYDVIYQGNETVISLIEDGVDTTDIFQSAIEVVRTQGEKRGIDLFTDFNRHHFGHGIGIDIYDPPVIAEGMGQLEAGMVIEVETPVYQLGLGGMNVEDTILVTEDGVERWTHYPEELQVIA